METTEKSIEVLNDLIEINNDRVAGFAHAVHELKENDGDLKVLFLQLREESRENVHELSTAINKNGGEAELDMSGDGALHRMWLDVKEAFTGHDRMGILAECERGEDAIKKAYESALSPDNELPPQIIEMLLRQQQDIIASHNQIKALRDSEA
ncbi:PA2169 family four-helix-bundle protein [Mucilaginibacter sp.]|uniref:PA2169 family four-helix-bundle protein n=1 Tax=Mucilaginibacter sp. TaxID=1882438 RepID=UPI002840061B|nr:PA2169 family four-helix-bundle protein [Mucilaginibacter sp.]MDR3695695.1 PA2169 family four-helix-bundle protein [Mucilaginibacter sp.]